MCGRYALISPVPEVEARVGAPFDPDLAAELPRYNAAPGQDLPIRRDAGGEIDAARWGFVPEGAERRADADHINARSETVREKPTFRDAFAADPEDPARGRCVVPADGFYEWTDEGPYYVAVEDGPALLAGVWAEWTPPTAQAGLDAFGAGGPADPEPVRTFAVLTNEPNALVSDLHHRMATVLDDGGAYLESGELPDAPFPAERMSARRVSTAVNDPSNDDPAVLTAPTE
jgi:putative SOS response-associated peptidase YedK